MNLSLFFLLGLFFSFQVWATTPQKTNFFVPQISVKMSLSGDMSNSYQFSGALGSSLKGAPEKAEGACENSSTFQNVLYRKKKAVQVWMVLKCSISGQSFEFKPQRFFIFLDQPDQTIQLPALSETFKKISVQLSELQIKDSQKKK